MPLKEKFNVTVPYYERHGALHRATKETPSFGWKIEAGAKGEFWDRAFNGVSSAHQCRAQQAV